MLFRSFICLDLFSSLKESRFNINASVQGTNAEVLNTMLEGTRTASSYTLRTSSKLLMGTAGETMPDIVLIDGDQYVVERVTAWQNLGPTKHYEVVVMRLEVDEN